MLKTCGARKGAASHLFSFLLLSFTVFLVSEAITKKKRKRVVKRKKERARSRSCETSWNRGSTLKGPSNFLIFTFFNSNSEPSFGVGKPVTNQGCSFAREDKVGVRELVE